MAAFASSYIKTEGSTVTRNADAASMTGTNFSSWFNNAEGTLFAAYSLNFPFDARRAVFATDGTTANRIGILLNSSNNSEFLVVSGSVVQATPQVSGITNINIKVLSAGAYAANDFISVANGVTSSTDTSGTVPSGLTQLSIGSQLNSQILNGHIRKLSFYPSRLSNAQLQALTTV